MKQVDCYIFDSKEQIRINIDDYLYFQTDLSHMYLIIPINHKFADSFSKSPEDCLFNHFENIK